MFNPMELAMIDSAGYNGIREEHIEKGTAPEGEMLVLQENVLLELKDETIIA